MTVGTTDPQYHVSTRPSAPYLSRCVRYIAESLRHLPGDQLAHYLLSREGTLTYDCWAIAQLTWPHRSNATLVLMRNTSYTYKFDSQSHSFSLVSHSDSYTYAYKPYRRTSSVKLTTCSYRATLYILLSLPWSPACISLSRMLPRERRESVIINNHTSTTGWFISYDNLNRTGLLFGLRSSQ